MNNSKRIHTISILWAVAFFSLFSIIGIDVTSAQDRFEQNINRQGRDYSSFDQRTATPFECRNACANDSRCKAWTYVKPGIQGPKARCWLKDAVPQARSSNCCTSGVKRPVIIDRQ
jgi:hypothetical protein